VNAPFQDTEKWKEHTRNVSSRDLGIHCAPGIISLSLLYLWLFLAENEMLPSEIVEELEDAITDALQGIQKSI
jgi:hypothetical protein